MNGRLFLMTWEQQVEYRKVHQWGVDFNNNLCKGPPAEELVEELK